MKLKSWRQKSKSEKRTESEKWDVFDFQWDSPFWAQTQPLSGWSFSSGASNPALSNRRLKEWCNTAITFFLWAKSKPPCLVFEKQVFIIKCSLFQKKHIRYSLFVGAGLKIHLNGPFSEWCLRKLWYRFYVLRKSSTQSQTFFTLKKTKTEKVLISFFIFSANPQSPVLAQTETFFTLKKTKTIHKVIVLNLFSLNNWHQPILIIDINQY